MSFLRDASIANRGLVTPLRSVSYPTIRLQGTITRKHCGRLFKQSSVRAKKLTFIDTTKIIILPNDLLSYIFDFHLFFTINSRLVSSSS